jgi:hypothetical protein
LNSFKNILFVIVGIFFISISFTTNTLGMNYSYRVEKGEEYIWTVIKGNPAILLDQGSKFRVNINEIYNGTWTDHTHIGTILNYSIDVYSTFYTNPRWDTAFNGSAMFFNETTQDLFIGFTTDWEIALFGMLFFIPTPINLTRIGNYLNKTSLYLFEDYYINGNILTMQNFTANFDFTFNFYDNGTLAEYKVSTEDSVGYHIKYGNILFPNVIPFGNYYLIFIQSTVLILIIFNRYKLKR